MDYLGITTRDPLAYMAALDDLRYRKLERQIRYCFDSSTFYRAKLKAAGVDDPAAIRNLEDFRALPAFLTKAEHRAIQEESLERDGHPYGTHLCAPLEKVIHVAATSGTTGHPTFYTFTRRDLDINSMVFGRLFRMAGLRPGDTVMQANGLSLWLAGITVVIGLEEYGARPIPVGAEAGTAKLLRYIRLTRPRAMFCTPSLASHLIERCREELGCEVGDLGLEILLCGGEPGSGIPAFRERIMDAYGAMLFDIAGGAWHNALISANSRAYTGLHQMSEDYCFRYDLIDPETRRPLPLVDGAVGEAIHTGLEYEAGPALRYATGDVMKLHLGSCPATGRFGARLEFVGRVDDLLMVKGIKVYPASIQEVLQMFRPDVSGEYRIRLKAPPPRVEPPLPLVVEADEGVRADDFPGLARRIEERMHALLSVRPSISVVPFGSLPRSALKTKVIEIAGRDGA